MSGIDLHAHTTASDGSLSPTDLVRLASERGLVALAVTDHDTLAGLLEAREAGRSLGVEIVNGIELGVEHFGRFHLLGYGFDPYDAALNDRLIHIQRYRANRNRKMVEKMQEYGLPISWEEVEAEAGGDLIARPHMALALKRKGVVETTQEAFDRFLQDGGPVHVPKIKMTDIEAIDLLRAAGGVSVIAHPTTLTRGDWDALEREVARLATMGLGGLEVYYSQYDAETIERLSALADRQGLVKTGGSDFHGDAKPHVHLGKVIGENAVPHAVLERLKDRIAAAASAG